jgi:N-acetylglucosamine malate deacetylase 1
MTSSDRPRSSPDVTDLPADCMAFGPHPDDIELGCSGALIKMTRAGARVVLVDLTRGELSTRGTVEIREREAAEAARIMGATARLNLGLADGSLENTPAARLAVIRALRAWRPGLVLLPYHRDRHPDHVHASRLVYDAVFASGLPRIETGQEAWRPARLLYYLLWDEFDPSFVVDITEVHETKMGCIGAFESQFSAREERYAPTRLTSEEFARRLSATMGYYGSRIGARYGEPYLAYGTIEMASPLEARFFSF